MHLRTLPLAALSLVALVAAARPVAAQTPDLAPDTLPARPAATDGVERPGVSPLLPPDHWAVAAVSRAEALGLVDGWLPAQRSVPRLEAGAALRRAAVRAAASGDSRLAAMVGGWSARFEEEFGVGAIPDGMSAVAAVAVPSDKAATVRSLGVVATAGYREWTGRLEPALGYFEGRIDPFPRPDVDDVFGRASAAVGIGGFAAALIEPALRGDVLTLDRWELAAGWHNWTLSLGEMPVGYGVARGGGLLLSNAAFPRAELRTERPLRLPGVLRHLGPVSAHTAVTRFDEPRHVGDPYFWTMRAAFQPHPRFTVGINRATMFGSDAITTPVTLGNVAKMFLGILSRDFENQEVSVDGRFRVPTESVLPLTLYLEWGSEDASGAWWTVPGITGGAFVPAIPGLPQVGVGLEATHFSTFCCGNPPWYSHGAFQGGWVLDGQPLGHPLGGEGREVMGYAVADLLDARLRLEGRAFVRSRGAEGLQQRQRAGNLFAPARAGQSAGGSVTGAWRVLPRAELRASWYRDAGDGWSEQRLTTDVSFLF